jgi:coniferyl-aldehyde dehydrogenase
MEGGSRSEDFAALHRDFAALSAADATPGLAARLARQAVRDGAERLAAAVDADFGGRPRPETMLAEVGLVLSHIDWTTRRLPGWLRVRKPGLPFELLPSRARVERVPLGVVAILAPWNYPLQLALLPLVAALAAGNRVLLHPSEATPRTSSTLADILGGALPPEVVRVVEGGPNVARALVRLPLHGIFFTGSAAAGREVMAAAAQNLVPVVLELGGKSPALVLPDSDLHYAAEELIAGKLFSAGQTCIAPDYVLAPRAAVPELLSALQAAAARRYPDPARADYAALARPADRDRLLKMVDGHTSVPLMPSLEPPQLGLVAVVDPDPGSVLMQEELFGPVLPIVPYDDPAAAITFVNGRSCPLAIYVFGSDIRGCEAVVAATRSGGAVINGCLTQCVAPALPFGGAGEPGLGAYHGEEGFHALSRPRSVLVQSRLAPIRLARPPYGRTTERLIRWLLR